MEIELNLPNSLPAVVLDRLFIKNVSVSVDKDTGEYIVRGLGIPSGKDANGNVIFDPDQNNYKQVNDDTFLTTAIGYAIANGEATDVADFMAQAATETANVNANTVTVAKALSWYIEGIAKIFEIAGMDIKGLK